MGRIRNEVTLETKHRTFARGKTPLKVCVISAILSLLFTNSAFANNALIGMPFNGKWAYNALVSPPYTDTNSSHPSVHHTPGGGDWATDVYAAEGTAVKLDVKMANGGAVTFSWHSSSTSCGQSTAVNVFVGGTQVGWLYFAHLNSAVTSGTITNGMTLGTVHDWVVSGVHCNPGVHVHVEFKNSSNYSCYVDNGNPGVTLSYDDDFGILGSSNNGPQQACSSTPPPTSQSGVTTTLNSSSSGPINDIYESSSSRHDVFTGTSSGNLFWSHWAPGDSSWTTGLISSPGSAINSVASVLWTNGNLDVYYGTSAGNLYESWYTPGGGWTTGTISSAGSSINAVSAQVINSSSGDQLNIYYGATDGTIRESWWKTGLSWSTSVVDTVSSSVKSIAILRPTGSSIVVLSGTSSGEVHQDYWNGPGYSWVGEQIAYFATALNSLTAMMSGTSETAYVGGANNNLYETWWTPGDTTWSTGTDGSYSNPITAMTGMTTSSGLVDIFSSASTTLNERYWYYGISWSGGQIATLNYQAVGATNMQTSTARIIYLVDSNNALVESWYAPGQSSWTTGQVGTVY